MRHIPLTLALLTGLALASPAMASPPDWKGPPPHAQGNKHGDERGERHDKHEYKHEHKRSKYKGHADISAYQARQLVTELHLDLQTQSLPPGIRKKLARGKPLPPGIAKQVVVVPYELRERLPRYPGYEWRRVGLDLILVEVGTRVVHDILSDIFLSR